MKIKKLALSLAITIVTGIGVTAYAETSNASNSTDSVRNSQN